MKDSQINLIVKRLAKKGQRNYNAEHANEDGYEVTRWDGYLDALNDVKMELDKARRKHKVKK